MRTVDGLFRIGAKAGERRLLPIGMPKLACMSLPMSFCIFCNGTEVLLSVDFIFWMIFEDFVGGKNKV